MTFRIILMDVYENEDGHLAFVEFESPGPEGMKWVGQIDKVVRTDKEGKYLNDE